MAFIQTKYEITSPMSCETEPNDHNYALIKSASLVSEIIDTFLPVFSTILILYQLFQLSERLLGNLNVASDLISIDMMRSRDAGLAPYNEYREVCGMPMAKEFEDFEDTIDQGVS